MSAKSHTIIFIPGAWHTTKCYDTIIDKLHASGYEGKLVRCELPSVGAEPGSPPTWSMVPDIKAIEAAVEREVEHGTPVLLVAHSYGSVPTACAIKKFAHTGMVKFCIVAGFMLEVAESMISWCGGVPPPLWRREGDFVYPNNPEQAFYNDLSEETQKQLVSELKSHSYATKMFPTTFEGWAAVPTDFVSCTKDNAVPLFLQDMMIDRAAARGVRINVKRIESGHSIMISQPDKLVEIIQNILG